MIPSMSRPAHPYANASCERFMTTLKREESYANTYRDLEHLRANLAAFIEPSSNRDRVHSTLGYHTPDEFERVPVRRPQRPEPACGFSGLERSLERHHPPGIRLMPQRRCEK
jgi:putative transposase